MKQKKSVWMRLVALAVTAAMSPAMLSVQGAVTEELEAAAEELLTETTEYTFPSESSGEGTYVPNTTGMAVYNSAGQAVSGITPVTGEPWTEQTVEGEETPTLKAPSKADFAKHNVYTVPESENLYTLTAATGVHSGSTVEYFAIRYVDSANKAQTKYIFPKVHSLQATNDYVASRVYGDASTVSSNSIKPEEYQVFVTVVHGTVLKAFTYDGRSYDVGQEVTLSVQEQPGQEAAYRAARDELSALGKNGYLSVISADESVDYIQSQQYANAAGVISPDTSAKHQTLLNLGYSINESTVTTTPLESWSVDEYFFKTESAISSVTGIEVFMSDGSWTVQGLSVSRVMSIGGYGEYGFYSGKYFLALDKQTICNLKSKKSGTMTLPANGDTLINIGGADSAYFSLETPKTQNSGDPFEDLVSFRIDVADELNAGLESLIRQDTSAPYLQDGEFVEDLALEIEYRDRNNWTRTVTMPVLLSVIGQARMYGDNVRTMGLAQRGDTLGFTATLPEYSSIISCKLHVGKSARSIIEKTGGIKGGSESLAGLLNLDHISISGLSVYEGTCRILNYPDGVDAVTGSTVPCFSYGMDFLSESPVLYYTTAMEGGTRINAGTSTNIGLTGYQSGNPLTAPGVGGNFLVRVKMDDVAGAGTDGNMRVRLTYTNFDGDEHTTDYYNVKDEMMNYIGYWPTSAEREGNYGFLYGASRGNYVEFPVTLSDAASVTNVEVSLDQASDDYQVSGISVSVLDSIGKRRIYGEALTAENGSSAYRIVRSLVHTVIPPFPISMTLHIAPSENYSLATGMGTITPTSAVDWGSMRYSMTYEQTKSDLGFIHSTMVYDVTVKVADDPSANSINGDSGSRNHFYFQLLFKNGTSGFVLANQQLSSDGFRAGNEEMFSIAVNRNYSDVTALRIIPEDVSEDSDVFDKLNIERITVTERTNGGAAMQYVFEGIGWIGIDYHDKAEDGSVTGRVGRSLSELVQKPYYVSYQRKVVNLLCEVAALPWDVNDFKFTASVQAEVTYLDTNDQPQTLSFDVISRIYDYAKRTPLSYEANTDGSNQSLYNGMGALSDQSTMLRPNHTDRFIMPPLANAKTVKSITFHVTNRSHGTAEWNIGGLWISRILSDSGIVTLTQSGTTDSEYIRSMDTAELCKMKIDDPEIKDKSVMINLPAGELVSQTIELTEASISWSENESWISAVTRMPESSNDTLNVYVYPVAASRNIAGVNVSAVFQYAIPFSKVMQAKQSTLNVYGSGTKDAMFYYTGIPAPDMQNLCYLGLTCRDSGVVFDHALVQQVRDSVVVATYDVPLSGASATLGLRASPSGSTRVYDKTRQTLMLSLGEDTEEMTLFGPGESGTNVNDIAVCFHYRSSLDGVATGKRNPEYKSPYVYLTDVGINKITPGLMAEIPFDMPYVAEITGYSIVSFGNVTGVVNGAVMMNYAYSDKTVDETTGAVSTVGDTRAGAYSMTDSYRIVNAISTHAVTWDDISGASTSLTPVELIVKTADADEAAESGVDVPVTITFHYTNNSNANVRLAFTNAQTYIQYTMLPDETGLTYVRSQDKQFTTGSEAHLRMFLPDCRELRSIEIQPIDPKGLATWKIDQISWSLDPGTAPQSRMVGRIFDSDGGTISVRNVQMTTNIFNGSEYAGFATMNAPKGIMTEGGTSVALQVRIENGEGFDYKAEWLVNDLPMDVTEQLCRSIENGFVFSPMTNESTAPEVYRLTISARDNPAVQNIVNVTVPAKSATSGDPQIIIIPGLNSGGEESTTESTESTFSDATNSSTQNAAGE